MTMQDSVADLLTRIRNALMRRHAEVVVPSSRLLRGILDVMREEGYIDGFAEQKQKSVPTLVVTLRYRDKQPAIRDLKRISKPSVRRYTSSRDIPHIEGGLGVVILSTNQGILSSRKARAAGIGGECLCSVF